MARTPLFRRVLNLLSAAELPASPEEAAAVHAERTGLARRDFLRLGGVAAAAIAAPRLLAACSDPPGAGSEPAAQLRSRLKTVSANIGIVGAGIAGIACAYELKRVGVNATIHEAGTRIGGRIWSDSGSQWLGQSIERGAELIDTPHKTMIGYARELGLTLEDITKPARETFYHFRGERIPERVMVEEYRVLVDAMRDTLRAVGSPTADASTQADRDIDNTSLAEWLDRVGAPRNIKALLNVAYEIEYGISTDRQSALSFLMFAKASRQAKLRLWGNFSDERYHVVGGNQQIPLGLAARLSGPINFGRKLVAMRKLSDGRVQLTFLEGSKTLTATHDAVVLALPFHLLRGVALDSSLGFPAWKHYAIQNALCGNNAKLMVGFQGRPWVEVGSNGAAYSDMPYLQTTWEASPSTANDTRGIITDYTGGSLSLSQSPSRVQRDCENFLGNYDVVYPGAKARARKDARGDYVCHLEHWPSNPLTQGAYTANQPGYFTTLEGLAGKPVGNVYFAGEMTDSFYSWQGFMEGGALTGLRAAAEISRDF